MRGNIGNDVPGQVHGRCTIMSGVCIIHAVHVNIHLCQDTSTQAPSKRPISWAMIDDNRFVGERLRSYEVQ